jgi:hypothetical protein
MFVNMYHWLRPLDCFDINMPIFREGIEPAYRYLSCQKCMPLHQVYVTKFSVMFNLFDVDML